MATPSDIARHVIDNFDQRGSTTLLRAATAAIVDLDHVTPAEAAAEAETRLIAVLRQLETFEPRFLPFEFSMRMVGRLIGKQRPRANEDAAAATARRRLELSSTYLEALVALGDRVFEFVCAAAMRLAGASAAFTTEPGDEGGIDFYGRIAIRPSQSGIAPTALSTSLIERQLLFVGQSKCVGPGASVDRATISQFNGDVTALLGKYEGNPRPPSHRVPESYYRSSETCLKVFITTGDFASGARTFGDASDVQLVNGSMLVQFLLYHGIGVVEVDGTRSIEPAAIDAWARDLDEQFR